jgi:FHS family L-fucose permease-like MFS transporter
MGMYVAMNFIQARLNPMSTADRATLSDIEFATMNQSDLSILITPYMAIGTIVLVMFLIILFMRMPRNGDKDKEFHFGATIRRILSVPNYREGVIAQFFYVGAQIMCWTFIIQYGTRIFMAQGMGEQAAEVLSQKHNIVAMSIFCVSRFVATYLMKFFNPGKMLRTFAITAAVLTLGVIFFQNIWGLYSLIAVSACMSLMFPTIYGIALKGMGEDAKFGAAGLIMAILGGSILPPLQARIIDMGTIGDLFPAVNASFVLPLISFSVVAWYGIKAHRRSII